MDACRKNWMGLVLVLAGLAGCVGGGGAAGWTKDRATSPRPSIEAPRAPSLDDPGARSTPRVVVEDVKGRDPARAKAMFEPLAARMEECAVGGSGSVRVRVESDTDSTRISIAPGGALRPGRGRCVLEALSTVDMDDLPSRANRSERGSGFSVTLRVEW